MTVTITVTVTTNTTSKGEGNRNVREDGEIERRTMIQGEFP
jgi:hypothetical protein